MTKWTSDSKQRRSKRYRDIHAKLAIEVMETKRDRKRKQSVNFKRSGDADGR